SERTLHENEEARGEGGKVPENRPSRTPSRARARAGRGARRDVPGKRSHCRRFSRGTSGRARAAKEGKRYRRTLGEEAAQVKPPCAQHTGPARRYLSVKRT